MERAPIERILCPIDFSEFSILAYDYATSLALHYGAKLFVQHAVEVWKYPSACFAGTAYDYERFCRDLIRSDERRLHLFVQDHSPDGFHPEFVVHEGMATESILSFAQKEAVDLIVIGTHGVRGFDRFVLGSGAEKVLKKAHCSVLAVHQTSRHLSRPASIRHGIELQEILFCTDFSDYSNRALDYALSVAAEYKANLTLVHVIEGISRLHKPEDTAKAHDTLNRLIPRQSRQDQRIATEIRTGRAYREICQLASEKSADLVIMAVHGSNSLDEAVFGSTTYRVVQLGSCPVLVVHPDANRGGPLCTDLASKETR